MTVDASVGAVPLVIGVGNSFRHDDGVGVAVLRELARRGLDGGHPLHLLAQDGEATRLVDAWDGRDVVVLVDAAGGVPPDASPGRLVALDDVTGAEDDLVGRWAPGVSGHGAGLTEAVALGRALDRLPGRLGVVAVVGVDFDHGEGLSADVAAAVPSAADEVLRLCGVGHGPGGGR